MIDVLRLGHSSACRAPAWHEVTKNHNMTIYNSILEANITNFGAELGALLVNQKINNKSYC